MGGCTSTTKVREFDVSPRRQKGADTNAASSSSSSSSSSATNQENPIKLKLLVVGEMGVGKSSVIRRYIQNDYTSFHKRNFHVEIGLKFLSADPSVAVEVWDVPAHFSPQNRSLYTEGMDGAIIVTDATNPASFKAIADWRKHFALYTHNLAQYDTSDKWHQCSVEDENYPLLFPVFLLANKCKDHNSILKDTDVGQTAEYRHLDRGFLVSAQHDINIDVACAELLQSMLRTRKHRKKLESAWRMAERAYGQPSRSTKHLNGKGKKGSQPNGKNHTMNGVH